MTPTKRQHAVLCYVRSYRAFRGYSPTYQEIADNFGVSRVTVFGHVVELERKGLIRRTALRERSIEVVETPSPQRTLLRWPILGWISRFGLEVKA